MIILFMDMLDDEEEKSKFRIIYEKYKKHMFYTANDILKDHHRSEDALQLALYRVAKNICNIEIDNEAQLKRYLEIITKNVALTMLKKKNKQYGFEKLIGDFEAETEELVSGFAMPEEELMIKLENENLYKAISTLDDRERDMILLYYFYEMPIKDVAVIFDVNYEFAKKRMQRIVKKLEKILRKGGFYEK